jgi:DNA gyrase subunit A
MEKDSGLVIDKALDKVVLGYITEYHRETSERSHADLHDGIKPVLRRIITNMWEENLNYFKKVAYFTGLTMGRYHPHGDTSISDVISSSMQTFNLNYIYFDAQGNTGSQDGDPAAAPRYLEARLAKFTKDVITDNIKEYALELTPNYDMTRNEFKYLPTKVPLILLQPQYGIGEGFMVSSPSFNLEDVVNSVIKYIKNKDILLKDLVNDIYPDYPTGGIITNKSEFKEFIKLDVNEIEKKLNEGKSFTLKIKAKCVLNNDKNTIEVYDLPYGVTFQKIQEQIIDEVQVKGNLILSNIINFGNHPKDNKNTKDNNLIFDIICKKDINMLEVLNELYKKTKLYNSITLSNIFYYNGTIKRVSFKDIIAYWYNTQYKIKRRTYNYEYSSIQNQIHVWEGLIRIYDSRNDVVEIIKSCNDKQDAIAKLVKKLNLSQVQAKGIVEMQLVALTRMSKSKLENDIKKSIEKLKELENNLLHIDDIIINDAREIGDKYKRARRTEIIDEDRSTSSNIAISSGAVLYTRNTFGIFNSQGLLNYRAILNTMKSFKENNKFIKEITGFHNLTKNLEGIVVFTKDGFARRIKIADIPLINTWIVNPDEISCICPIYDLEKGNMIVINDEMHIRRIKIDEITSKVTVGNVRAVHYSVSDDELILIYDKYGKYIYLELSEIPILSRNSSGNKLLFDKNNNEINIYPINNSYEGLILLYGDDKDAFIGVMGIDKLIIGKRNVKPKGFIENNKMNFIGASPISLTNRDESQIVCIGGQNISIMKLKGLKIDMSPKHINIKAKGFIQL